ncbi:MAG: CopG family transcriptional regulator [Candidatus Marinimicrobia bacterium]|nr:CopG family transcriptional regulator [Candidatus Neomarinimicrobiota bacterium]MBL7059841.1 CopG family transcriptional regulator [Candidatus Neomarinimicrobiota bacterium]
MKKSINIRMDENTLAELDRYGSLLERTRTYLIEKAVTTYFDTLDEIVSDKRIDDVKSGRTHVMSLEEVAEKLELANV